MTFTQAFQKLLFEGILPGVGSVLSFIPTVAGVIFVLSLLRECGIIRGITAHLITGFSCSVPAILSCCNIHDTKRRYLTMLLIPYMSCSAKLPIYVMLASAFFPAYPYIVIGAIYSFGIILAFIFFVIAKVTGFRQDPSDNASSLLCKGSALTCTAFAGRFRHPSMRIVFKEVADCCIGFLKKAFTVILAASIIIWLLQNLDTGFRFTSDIENSLLAHLGRMTAPLFAPLGFGDWRASAALITGLSAKEAVVSTFAVIAGSAEGPALCMMLEDIFSPLSAFCFMIFCLLYMPCIATLTAIKNVTGKVSISMAVVLGQTAVAWLLSFLIFQLIKVII